MTSHKLVAIISSQQLPLKTNQCLNLQNQVIWLLSISLLLIMMRPSVSLVLSLLVLSCVTVAVHAQSKLHDIDKLTACLHGKLKAQL